MTRRDVLIDLRKQKHWSQRDVVARLHKKFGREITVSYYGMIEQGARTPKLDLALDIAGLFRKTPKEIFLPKNPTKRWAEESHETNIPQTQNTASIEKFLENQITNEKETECQGAS